MCVDLLMNLCRKRSISFCLKTTTLSLGTFSNQREVRRDKLLEDIKHTKSLGHNIHEILSDNGGEFHNQEITDNLNT